MVASNPARSRSSASGSAASSSSSRTSVVFTYRSVSNTFARTGPLAMPPERGHVSAMLESYAAGRWFRAADDGQPLLDAATGEEVARISSRGLRRRRDGPARPRRRRARAASLTFHERAALLKALAKHLPSARRSSTRSPYATGATKRDSMVDIDGGIGTLFSYASKGARELPNDTVFLDGGARAARQGRHVRRPAPLHLAAGCRRADQRLQLPGLGHAREARPGLPRRAARRSSSPPARRPTSPSSPSAGSSSRASCPRGAPARRRWRGRRCSTS